jgi:hypothetical protein
VDDAGLLTPNRRIIVDLEKLYRDPLFRSPAYVKLSTETVGPDGCEVTVTKYAKAGGGNSRRYQVRDAATGELLHDTDDCHDSGNAVFNVYAFLDKYAAKLLAEGKLPANVA